MFTWAAIQLKEMIVFGDELGVQRKPASVSPPHDFCPIAQLSSKPQRRTAIQSGQVPRSKSAAPT